MRFKAVIFDLGGVLTSQPQVAIRQYGERLKLPPSFLGKVFMNGAPNNSFCRLERGELLFTDFVPEFEKEVQDAGKREGFDVSNFNASSLFKNMAKETGLARKEMLYAIKVLSRNGVKTCALTNNWVDDRADFNQLSSKFMVILTRFFDAVIESAKVGIRKPDPKIYQMACKRLEVKPQETIFLDDIGANLKTARELGITCIKVVSSKQALQELQELTNLDLLPPLPLQTIHPPPCKPDDVPHSIALLRSGLKIHYVDVGEGPVVMLFHGFPESWYSWRYQIPALVAAGYRVIAMDQRGYGDSSVPHEIEEYTQEKICQDAIDLMDCLGIAKSTIVGHDWGGAVVWNLALFYPHRIQAVCGVNTPFFTGTGLKKLQEEAEIFNYQMYFQDPGVAEKEFEQDMARAFKILFRGVEDEVLDYPDGIKMKRDSTNVTKRGGFMVGYPQSVTRGKLITEADLDYYVQQFKKTGFRGPLNWYRNFKANTEWQQSKSNRKIAVPALMVTSSHDAILKPKYTLGMEDRVTNLSRLDLQQCAHWTQFEKPDELNDGLIKWLDSIHGTKSKL